MKKNTNVKNNSTKYSEYRNDFIKSNYVQLPIRFKTKDKKEMSLYEYACSKKDSGGITQYIKSLIEKDMEKSK